MRSLMLAAQAWSPGGPWSWSEAGDRGEAGAGGDGNEATASDLVHIFRHHPSSPSLSSLATREWARASQMDLTGLLAHSNPFIDSRKESKALAPQTFVQFRATLNVTFKSFKIF